MSTGWIGRQGCTMLLATVGYLAALGAPAAAAADPAAAIYDPGRMYVIELTLSPQSEAELADEPFEYVPGTFAIAESPDGTPDEVGDFSSEVDVGIRLKGSASLRPLSGKSAFKIKFKEADRLRGLRILTLNNMVEDPSMLHETLAYKAYGDACVPASRTGYAYVYVNGEDFGVHLNIETLDEVALEKLFGSFDPATQHLYEAEYGFDLDPDPEGGLDVDEGGPDHSDLAALVEAVNSSGPPDWPARVAAVADLQEMTRMWATEKYIGQWDGYAGKEENWLPNNYYLFSDPVGRFQMLPWGNDETWQEAYHLPFDGRAGLMFNLCLDDPVCRGIYRGSVASVHAGFAGMGLDPLARRTAAMLVPWQQMEDEESEREEWSLEEIGEGVDETLAFIASRPAEAAQWLGPAAVGALPGCGDPGPEAPAGPAVAPPAAAPPASPASSAPAAGAPARSLRVGRLAVKGGVLRTRLRLSSAGLVTLRAKTRGRGKAAVVCRKRVRVKGAGGLTLRCRLPRAVRERLREKPGRITVLIRFVAAGGDREAVTRWIVWPLPNV